MDNDMADTYKFLSVDTASIKVEMDDVKVRKRKKHECKVCGVVCGNKRKFYNHEKTHLSGEFKCALCSRKFNQQRLLTSHYRRHTHEELKKIGIVHFCPKCGVGYSTKEECTRHVKNMNCTTQEKNHTCEICGRAFALKRGLKAHIMTHTGEKPYVCDKCNRGFICMSLLLKHEAIHTGETEKFLRVCDICGKTFRSSGGLSNHYAQKHSGKTFPCETCGKHFNSKEHLRQHILIHTGEKNHVCEICGKAFTYRNGLLSHSYTHVKKVDYEKPHICDICSKAFRTKNEIYRHYQIHAGEKPHKCEYCGKCFNQKFTLRVHQRQHTGEKPNSCKYCDMKFISHSAMKRHEVHHLDEKETDKSFPCDICEMTFKRKSALAHHKKHHKASAIPVEPSNESDQNQEVSEIILPDVLHTDVEVLCEKSGSKLIADLTVDDRSDE